MTTMIQAKTRMLAPALMSALLAVLAGAGCSVSGNDDADKAGGSDAPVVLRLAVADDADQPDAPFARYFARRVSALSDGSVRVRVVWDAAGQDSPGYELGIARLVKDGDFELGWMGARAWDRMGIRSFQALQAPFLVTDHDLLGRITTGPLAARMLSGLDGHGFVGLALVPERLRYALGAKKALASPGAFAGARVQVKPSAATDATMRALGATPVHISGDALPDAVAKGEIDGSEASLGTNSPDEGQIHLTANLPLFPKTLTLFAGDGAYDRLAEGQRKAVRQAARLTAAYAAAHAPSETALVRDFCRESPPFSAVAASPGDITALEDAAHPVYTQMERDPDTRATIAAIRALKATSRAAPAAAPPVTCEAEPSTVSGRERSPSAVNGTYHWRVTEAGGRAAAEAVGGTPHQEDLSAVGKMTLRDGRWLLGEEDPEHYSGTYRIVGDKLVFDWGESTLTFEFARDGDGTIRLTPVAPMNAGDAVVWAGGPWQRVGPPVRDVP
jgi:TRAP-type C4-dicarboxylate transport system substrate-binding protein